MTDEQGSYRADALQAGQYRLEAALDGFEPSVRRLMLDDGQTSAIDMTLTPSRITEGVIVTARRIEEAAQEVPIPVSVVSGDLIESVGAFNVNRLKDLIPTVQFYSTNPRNSAINIRGLGAPFGLTNDGIEPGVGLYIDGVFYARPAAATLDFLDVERIEVLRGPQGTLFGKNTTAGAINVTTRRPTFTPQTDFELNYGNLDFVQAKGVDLRSARRRLPAGSRSPARSVTARSTTPRLETTVNDLNNLGLRGQMLFAPSDKIAITAAVDHTRQRPEGYTQVVAGVAPTLRNREPAVPADRRRSRLRAAELQRLRPADRRRHAPAVLPGSRRRVVDCRLGPRAGPADLDDGVALLGLESVERPRLHRPAGHDDLGRRRRSSGNGRKSSATPATLRRV